MNDITKLVYFLIEKKIISAQEFIDFLKEEKEKEEKKD